MRKLTSTALMAIATSSALDAATVNVDFGRTTTTGNINNLATADITSGSTISIADLVDTTGASSGVSILLETDDGVGSDNSNVGTYANTIANAHNGPYDPAVLSGLGLSNTDTALLGDGINVINSNDPTITLGGFASTDIVELRIYNARGAGTGGPWDYDVTDNTGTSQQSDSNILDNTDLIVFSNLVPDSNGEITTVLSKGGLGGGSRGGINFLQIVVTPVPEPSSALLVGLGMLAFIRRRRN